MTQTHPIYKKLGKNVQRLLGEHGMSQGQLATRANIRQARISEIINGKANLQMDTLIRLADALDTTVSELLT